jgi:hypothetical protein
MAESHPQGQTMPLCFEVTINDELPILAGLRDLKVLTDC